MTLLGPSGCGKTTLLNLVAGFLEPDGGEIVIDGERVTDVPTYQREIGMVFQNYALFPHMTVADNVAYGLKMRGIATDEIARRVGEALALVKLAGMEDRKPRQLSGGQQQRVALARALVDQSEGAAARRAVLRARQESARLDAGRAEGDPAQARRHDDLRHPRPERGAEPVRPDRRDVGGPHPPDRHADGDLPPALRPVRRLVRRRRQRDARPAGAHRRRPRSASH